MWQYQNTDELYHHGILGMRWGHRKARTSSSSGGKRKKKNRMSNRAYRKYKLSSKDSRRAQIIKRKPVNQMSNEELKTLNYRQSLEYQYKQNNKSKISKIAAGVGITVAAIGTINKLYSNMDNLKKNGKTIMKNGRNIYDKFKYTKWLYSNANPYNLNMFGK